MADFWRFFLKVTSFHIFLKIIFEKALDFFWFRAHTMRAFKLGTNEKKTLNP